MGCKIIFLLSTFPARERKILYARPKILLSVCFSAIAARMTGGSDSVWRYFRIQHYRFGDKLNLVIESPPEDTEAAYRCLMPKMTLQPIVENAVYPGIEPKLGTGTLRIRIELTQKRLIVTVSDDGLGMEPEKRDALNQKLSMISIDEIQSDKPNRNGIALINVNTRIKLLFGEAYGLHIFSSPNVGTDVVVTLPLHIEGGTG